MYTTAMAQEEQRCSNSSSGGGGGGSRSSKKAKQKKIPQRGLGVAQLEKMRLEEQQKKAAAACIVFPLPQQQQQQQQLPIPFSLPPPSTDLPPIFSPSIPISGLDLLGPAPATPPPLPHDINSQVGNSPTFPAIWNFVDFDHDPAAERGKLEEQGKLEPMFQFRPPLQNEPNPLWRSSMQRKQSQKQQQQASSTVNVSSSPLSSGVHSLQMEPPSNQSYCSNSTPPWPEEERMVRMKRPWPFSLDDSFQFHCKFSPLGPSFRRWDESSCGHDLFKFDSGNVSFREGLLSSNTVRSADDLNLTKTESLDGRFLTLGPPASSSIPKSKQPISAPSTHHSEFDLLPFQGGMEYPFPQPGVMGQRQQPFYSFLPMGPSSHPPASSDGRVKGADGAVDLNLKL